MKVYYQIDQETIACELEGETLRGGDEVLLLSDVNLLQDTQWNDIGYTVAPFTTADNFEKIKAGLTKFIGELIEKYGGKIDSAFSLEKYHRYVTDELHLHIAKDIQYGRHVSEFPIDFSIVNARLSEILAKSVSAVAKHVDFNNFFVRIVRPGKVKDNNPPHRDVWIERLRNAVNIYAPICGSSSKSSLPLVPGSHFLKESSIERTASGAFLNNTQYTVPCVISIDNEMPKLTRPYTKENELMLFSPYLVHGGGYNLSEDTTRISLEIRFWKVD